MQNSKFKIQNILRAFCIFNFAFLIAASAGCSMPNLESPECTEARITVRELYSFHFGNDMKPSVENIELRTKFITPSFKEAILSLYRGGVGVTEADEFTKTVTYFPKAFRVGKCTSGDSEANARFEVVLFWRDDERNDQRTLTVDTVKQGEKWLVDNIALDPR